MFDGPLTFREFMTHEELPLATIFREVLTYLRRRTDAVLFGAHAVNAWCEPARMTADVDVMSVEAATLVEDLRGLVAMKVVSIAARDGKPKALTDRVDVARLLLGFGELRDPCGPVAVALRQMGAGEGALALWRELAAERLVPDDEDDDAY
jgi:hypothetical protein